MKFSLRVGPQVVTTNKPHGVNWPLIYFYLVLLSLLKSPALVNDYWKVIQILLSLKAANIFYLYQTRVCHFDQK